MRPKAVTVYLPSVESVADAFIERLKKIRTESKRIPNLRNEISKWNVKCKINMSTKTYVVAIFF